MCQHIANKLTHACLRAADFVRLRQLRVALPYTCRRHVASTKIIVGRIFEGSRTRLEKRVFFPECWLDRYRSGGSLAGDWRRKDGQHKFEFAKWPSPVKSPKLVTSNQRKLRDGFVGWRKDGALWAQSCVTDKNVKIWQGSSANARGRFGALKGDGRTKRNRLHIGPVSPVQRPKRLSILDKVLLVYSE